MPGTRLSLRYHLMVEGPLAVVDTAAGWRVRGSTIKGVARRQATALAPALGLPSCRQDGADDCVLCQLFGAPGVAGALRWSDAAPVQEQGAAPSRDSWRTARSRRPVSRALGTAVASPALIERVDAAGQVLAGTVDGWLPFADAGAQEQAAALLAGALGLVRRVGGGQGDGAGAVRPIVETVQLRGEERAVGTLLDALAGLARS